MRGLGNEEGGRPGNKYAPPFFFGQTQAQPSVAAPEVFPGMAAGRPGEFDRGLITGSAVTGGRGGLEMQDLREK